MFMLEVYVNIEWGKRDLYEWNKKNGTHSIRTTKKNK